MVFLADAWSVAVPNTQAYAAVEKAQVCCCFVCAVVCALRVEDEQRAYNTHRLYCKERKALQLKPQKQQRQQSHTDMNYQFNSSQPFTHRLHKAKRARLLKHSKQQKQQRIHTV